MSTKDLNDLSYTDAAIATVVGGLILGKGLAGTAGISMGGAYIGSQIEGEDATAPVIGAGAGAAAGKIGEKHLSRQIKDKLPKAGADLLGSGFGSVLSEKVGAEVEKK